MSYGLSADPLSEILSLGRTLHATTVRRHVQAVAQRLDASSLSNPTGRYRQLARGGSAADGVGKVVRVVDSSVRALRRAAVDRLAVLDRPGDLTSEHVRLVAATVGVAERTVWR